MGLPVFIVVLAAAAHAAVDLDALAQNSPFGGGTSTAATASVDTGGLELRGMYVDGGKTFFSIYNAATKQSAWVAQGDLPTKEQSLGVRAFDRNSGVATVETSGRTVQLALKQSSIAKYEAPKPEESTAFAGGPPGFGQPGPDGKVQTPWGNFTPEQIAAFRAEREKRWAERMAQAQQEGKPGPAEPEGGAPKGDRRERGERGSRGGKGG